MIEFIAGRAPISHHHRDAGDHRPEGSDFAEVMMPESRGKKRQQGNGKEHSRKGHDAVEGEHLTQIDAAMAAPSPRRQRKGRYSCHPEK